MSRRFLASVINNALDFLNHSIQEVEAAPKYSVIHFCAAVELLLKARLMDEHWTLILKEPIKADLSKFQKGEFVSISMEGALSRLENVCGETMPEAAKSSLERVRKHRNHLIHFFSPKLAGTPEKKAIADIVAEQCKAWFHLHQLLTGRWKATFKRHMKDLEKADDQMHGLRTYLKAKFEALTDEIAKDSARGIHFSKCSVCGFVASEEEAVLGPLCRTGCRVCGESFMYVKLDCPGCNRRLIVDDPDSGVKCRCQTPLSLDTLLGVFGTFQSPKDESIDPAHAYCGFCAYTAIRSSVPINDKWLCLHCFDIEDDVTYCDWCGAKVTGELEGSFFSGCTLCGGKSAHLDDD